MFNFGLVILYSLTATGFPKWHKLQAPQNLEPSLGDGVLGTLSVDGNALHVEPGKSFSIMPNEHLIKMSSPGSLKADGYCFWVSALTVAAGFRLASAWIVNHFVSILDFLSPE